MENLVFKILNLLLIEWLLLTYFEHFLDVFKCVSWQYWVWISFKSPMYKVSLQFQKASNSLNINYNFKKCIYANNSMNFSFSPSFTYDTFPSAITKFWFKTAQITQLVSQITHPHHQNFNHHFITTVEHVHHHTMALNKIIFLVN